MRKISEIRNLPISQLSDEEIVKATRDRLGCKAVVLIILDQQDHAWTFTRWASTKDGGKVGKAFLNAFNYHLKHFFNMEEWKLPF